MASRACFRHWPELITRHMSTRPISRETMDDCIAAVNQAMSLAATMLQTGSREIKEAKGDRDFATATDLSIEAALRGLLAGLTPDIPLLGEERGGVDIGAPLFWTLDPVDGTINFAQGMPLCGISLALVNQGRAVIGAIELPFLGQSYRAVAGHGVRCNGEAVRVSSSGSLAGAVIAFGDFAVGSGAGDINRDRLKVIKALSSRVMRVRMLGSAAVDLAWVASGRLHASVIFSNKAWDMQAGALLVREAGGVVCDLDGSMHDVFSASTIAASPALKKDLLELLNEAMA